jgi:hypothetical protein
MKLNKISHRSSIKNLKKFNYKLLYFLTIFYTTVMDFISLFILCNIYPIHLQLESGFITSALLNISSIQYFPIFSPMVEILHMLNSRVY